VRCMPTIVVGLVFLYDEMVATSFCKGGAGGALASAVRMTCRQRSMLSKRLSSMRCCSRSVVMRLISNRAPFDFSGERRMRTCSVVSLSDRCAVLSTASCTLKRCCDVVVLVLCWYNVLAISRITARRKHYQSKVRTGIELCTFPMDAIAICSTLYTLSLITTSVGKPTKLSSFDATKRAR
jgi:hypothetical protein